MKILIAIFELLLLARGTAIARFLDVPSRTLVLLGNCNRKIAVLQIWRHIDTVVIYQ